MRRVASLLTEVQHASSLLPGCLCQRVADAPRGTGGKEDFVLKWGVTHE
jgi:hypothetical protein